MHGFEATRKKACVGVLVCLLIGGVSVEAAASTLKVGACENYWPQVGEDHAECGGNA